MRLLRHQQVRQGRTDPGQRQLTDGAGDGPVVNVPVRHGHQTTMAQGQMTRGEMARGQMTRGQMARGAGQPPPNRLAIWTRWS